MSRFFIAQDKTNEVSIELEYQGFTEDTPAIDNETDLLSVFIDKHDKTFFLCNNSALDYSKKIIRYKYDEEAILTDLALLAEWKN